MKMNVSIWIFCISSNHLLRVNHSRLGVHSAIRDSSMRQILQQLWILINFVSENIIKTALLHRVNIDNYQEY